MSVIKHKNGPDYLSETTFEDINTHVDDEENVIRVVKSTGDTMTGQLLLSGAGIAWDDLRTPVQSLKLSGTKPPSWVTYKGTELLAFSDQSVLGNEEHIFFAMQVPHNYKIGTNLHMHVHYVPEDNTGGNVYWALTYSWASIEEAFPGELTIRVASPCGTTTDAHKMSEFPEISGLGKGISSMIICKLQRNSSDALDTYNGKSVYLLEIDAHYEIDSFGSAAETTKVA